MSEEGEDKAKHIKDVNEKYRENNQKDKAKYIKDVRFMRI